MRRYALRLVALESRVPVSTEPRLPAEWRIFESLRSSLSTLVGVNGFRVLVTRALTLARAEAPELRNFEVNAEGGIQPSGKPSDKTVEPEAGIMLVTHLLTLLGAFIGETLLLRILSDVWPDLASFDSTPPGEIEHDPTR